MPTFDGKTLSLNNFDSGQGGGHRMVVMSHDVIHAEKNIQFSDQGVPLVAVPFNFHIVQNDIKIVAPIVELWDMGVLQGIIDRQLVETEAL